MTAQPNQYTELFAKSRGLIDKNGCELMNRLREEACARFCGMGFPTRKVERYKYTDVASAFAPDYGLNLSRVGFPVNAHDVFRCNVPNLGSSLHFIVNDSYQPAPHVGPSLPQGVLVGSLKALSEEHPSLLSAYYGRLALSADDALTALNTMFAQDGLLVYVPRNIRTGQTIQVVNISQAGLNLMANRRVLIVLEEGAEACVLLCDHTADEHSYLSTQVVEVFAAAGSRLALYELEETQTPNRRFSNLYVKAGSGADVTLGSITLHNGLTRNRTDVCLSGRGARVNCYGAVIGSSRQHTDNNIRVVHEAEGCTSNLLYKYVLDEQAVGAFAGHVLVRHGAQKTESQQTNANLCVSDEARMYTQPMLEIYADDVKCNHGSSVGNLDKQALFYMQQRGLPLAEAHLLLQHAFLYDVVRRIELEPLRDRLSHLIEKRFRGELTRCEGCTVCGAR